MFTVMNLECALYIFYWLACAGCQIFVRVCQEFLSMLLSNDDGLFTFTTVFGCPEKLPWMENNINSILKTAQSNPHRMNHLHNERLDFFQCKTFLYTCISLELAIFAEIIKIVNSIQKLIKFLKTFFLFTFNKFCMCI